MSDIGALPGAHPPDGPLRTDSPRAGRPARARSLSCPNCGGTVTIRASGSTVTALCPACGTVLDVANESVRVIAEAQGRTRTPPIAIGTRGTLEGTEWQVVGYQERSAEAGSWQWEEYLLFNPFQGFRFLGQDHGKWTLYQVARDDFGDTAPPPFRATEENTARTDYVLGEFYWRVRVGDEVAVREFVDGSRVLSRESNGTEVTWSRGTVLAPNAVRQAFGLAELPGEAAAAPGPLDVWPLWRAAAVAAALLVLLHALPFAPYRNFVALRQDFTATAKSELVSPEFDLPGSGGSAVLEASSAFNADYVNVRLSLLPVSGGGRGFNATMALGGLFGTTAEPQRTVLSGVPGGRYKLAVEIDSGAFAAAGSRAGPALSGKPPPDGAAPGGTAPDGKASVTVTATVRRHPASSANFWTTLLLLLAWPGGVTAWRWAKRALRGGSGKKA